jgi:hypothetical protein
MIRCALLFLALAACTAQSVDPRSVLTRAVIDRSPQPLLLAEVPVLGVAATLAPQGSRDGVITWRTAQGQALSFRDGVLIATRGLGHDLISADVAGTLAALNGGPQAGYARLMTYLDGQNQTIHRAMLCDMGPALPDPVVSFGLTFPALRRDEVCATTGDTVTNRYWLGEDGVMRRSEQWIGPALGTLATELLTR